MKEKAGNKTKVGVLGLSYKPDTDVVEESPGVFLAESLIKDGRTVIVYDPAALDNARKVLKDQVIYANSLDECVGLSEVMVITTPWKEFCRLPLNAKRPEGNSYRPLVIDCWRILDPSQQKEVEYEPLGRGSVTSR